MSSAVPSTHVTHLRQVRGCLLIAALACAAAGLLGSPAAGAQSVLIPEVVFRDGFDPPPPPPFNDSCGNAVALLVGGAPANGTTAGANNDYDSGLETCTGLAQAGADVVYSVVLLSSTSYTVTLSNPDGWFDPSIALIGPGLPSVCSPTPVTCLAGSDQNGVGGLETFPFTPNTSGTYYIVVDSYFARSFDGGKFTIAVTSH